MAELYAGTSGFAYKEWKGSFYPEELKNDDMLSFYAERFRSVEINNTFYRMPKASVLEKWRDEVPEGFRFVLKAPRRITHQQRLKDAEDSVRYLVDTSAALGEKRGPFLFQLPPFLKKDVERLERFLGILPAGVRAAFEFRNQTWFDEEVYGALRRRDAALCIADSDGEAPPPAVATTRFGYLRLRRPDYDDAALAAWAECVRRLAWEETFVFFKHEDAGAGPRLAQRFEALCHAAGVAGTRG